MNGRDMRGARGVVDSGDGTVLVSREEWEHLQQLVQRAERRKSYGPAQRIAGAVVGWTLAVGVGALVASGIIVGIIALWRVIL